MHRVLSVLRDVALVACAMITAYFAVFPAAPVAVGSSSAPLPWWVAAIGAIAFGLFVLRIIRFLSRAVYQPFKFFPDRASLHAEDHTLGKAFENAETVWALWVVGQKFYNADYNVTVVKRLLLPNPNGESFSYFALANPDKAIKENIEDITIRARATGAQVRWYDHFIYHSINLVDVNKRSGWIHIEGSFTAFQARASAELSHL